jgi:hypothetical protein
MNKISSYKEILAVLNKHKDILDDDYEIDISAKISNRICILSVSKEFGIDIDLSSHPDWCKLSEYEAIGLFGEDHNRTISWSDDDRQPENERLYRISFPTGAYIFGESYPEITFKSFFSELKTYGYKYIDSANKCLYFTSENAKYIHENFNKIFDKYKRLVSEEMRMKKIESLREELDKLESK